MVHISPSSRDDQTEVLIMTANVRNMASVREVPWHGIGEVLTDYTDTAEMLRVSGSDYEVEFRYIYAGGLYVPDQTAPSVGDDLSLAPGFYAVRVNAPHHTDIHGKVFAVVRSRFRLFQNQDVADFGSSVITESGTLETLGDQFGWETMGNLGSGERFFATLKLPTDLLINGQDAIQRYFLLATAHDGSMPLIGKNVRTRVVCSNTMAMALAENSNEIKIRHTTNMAERVEEARRALGFASSYELEFKDAMERLAATSYTMSEFEQLTEKMFPSKGDGATSDKSSEIRLSLIGNYATSPTLDGGIRDTRYGALNAVTEWAEWQRKRNDGKRSVAERQTEGVLLGGIEATVAQKAFNLLTADLDDAPKSKPKARQKLTQTVKP